MNINKSNSKLVKLIGRTGIIVLFILTNFMFFQFCVKGESNKAIYNIKQTEATANSATITWDADEQITDFMVTIYYNDATFNEYTKNKTFKIEDMTTSRAKVKITACDSNKNKVYETYDTTYIFSAPEHLGRIKLVEWKHKKNVVWIYAMDDDGINYFEYQLYDLNGKCYKKGKECYYNGFSSIYIKGVKNEAISNLKIRGYNVINNKKYYTSWENVELIDQASVKRAVNNGKSLKVNWNKIKGASGYDVYVSTYFMNRYKKVGSYGKNSTSCTINKIMNNPIKASTNYNVYVVAKKKGSAGINYSKIECYWNTDDNGKKTRHFDSYY